jgi:hypothetical protein
VQDRLDAARKVNSPDFLFTEYVASQGHAQTHEALLDAGRVAETIALLAATHDSIYSGSGAIGLDEAAGRITAALSGGRSPGALQSWGLALLEQMESRPATNAAMQGRAQAAQLWGAQVRSLEPAAVGQLQTYIGGLPAVTVEGLRGHPVAGPALDRLEETSRQVSRGTTSPSARR